MWSNLAKKLAGVTIAAAGLAFAGCDSGGGQQSATSGGDSGTPEKKVQIAVIPKGTTHVFWKSVHAGAEKAAQEAGIEIIWMGPEREDDRSQQIDVVQNFISRGVDAIVLAPLDSAALVRPVETAISRGIPVVIIDSDLDSDKHASFVATDNREGGRLGARRLGELLGGKGKAIMIRYAEGSASTQNREEGFLEVMKSDFPDIELVSTDQYAGATKESALQVSQNLLTKFGDEIQGIFAPNESSAFGMLRALQISGRAGKIHFVGFDTSEGLLNGMAAGEVEGLVSQDPFDMGYQGVMAAVATLKGETVEKRIATRLEMITPDNVGTPEIQELITPDLEKWLGK